VFFVRKALSRFFPLPLTLLLLIIGLALPWSQGQQARQCSGAPGLGLLLVFSWPVTSAAILRPLESRYPALGPAQMAALNWDQVDTIVVYVG
jgi:uncharacterized SAM-binding protein YcdF (DUF218 family)